MTERARPARRPGPALVVWGSIVLFAALFALLTYRLSVSQPVASPRPVLVRKVLKRHIITTYVPSPGRNSVSTSGAVSGETSSAYAPVTTSAS